MLQAPGVVTCVPDAEELLRRIAADLRSFEARWALVGALAVAVRAEPRFTRDIDLAVAAADDDHVERLVYDVSGRGYHVVSSTEHETSGRIAMVRLIPSQADAATAIIDLLFASSGIENEIVDEAEEIDVLPDVRAAVAQTGHLIALKLLSGGDDRPYDVGDAQRLIRVASPRDLQVAKDAIALITARGYNRGRNLAAALDDAIDRGA